MLVREARDAVWTEGADGTMRELDQIYGFGYVRTSLIRHARAGDAPVEHRAYVMQGKVGIGPAGEEVDVAAGDFIRFPGDVPHRTVVQSETRRAVHGDHRPARLADRHPAAGIRELSGPSGVSPGLLISRGVIWPAQQCSPSVPTGRHGCRIPCCGRSAAARRPSRRSVPVP